MAFFDKLNQVAKNLGDKTTDAIETTKLNTKIHSEKNAAEEELKKIGEFYYNVFANGGSVAPEVLEFCQKAKEHYDAIEGAQAGINQIKADNEAAKTAAQAPVAPTVPVYEAPVTAAPTGNVCSSCGAINAEGTKFCFECGNKLEESASAAPVNSVCPNCGAPVIDGLRFCGECGTKIG